MSTSTLSQIRSSASYHLSLLQTLESLQYAPSALNQQSKYLRDLQAELASVKKEVKQLGEKTKKERKEHEELRDSTTRRLAARLKGKSGLEKFEAKKEKEERFKVFFSLAEVILTRNVGNTLWRWKTKCANEVNRRC